LPAPYSYETTEEFLRSSELGRQIIRIRENVSAALTAIGAKGVTVPSGSNSDDLADLIGAIQTGGGGSSAQTATGTISGSGNNILQIPCDFAPDLIYVYGDMSGSASLRGCVSFTIIKDTYLEVTVDGSTSSTDEFILWNDHSITGYSSDTSMPHGEYTNGVVRLDVIENSSAARFNAGVTYSYKFVKWT